MTSGYKIMVNGRTVVYETLELAMNVASEVFARTGIVVGIEQVTNSEED